MSADHGHDSADGVEAARNRLAAAITFAIAAHGGQTRKGTPVPYVSHLLQVSGLVLEHGGDGEQAVAALLHDVVEDTAAATEEVAAIGVRGVPTVLAGGQAFWGDDRLEEAVAAAA